jgi:transcription elongation factor/antiterminator RfaH
MTAIASQSGAAGASPHNVCADARWYAAHTQPRAESRAVYNLEMQGFRVLCPRFRKTVRHARKAKVVLAPLFPNYLFVHFDLSRDRWRSVNGTRGVVHLLMLGGMPQSVPNDFVDGVRARMRADGSVDWRPTLSVGDAVRIADGPFAAFLGTLEYLDAAGRVRVLLDLLGRSVPVHLRCEEIVPANVG